MDKPSIGDRELALLHHIDECGDASVGEVAVSFGESHGLARSTVLTMMERLRMKAFLRRRKIAGVYRYSPAAGAREAVRHVVGRFVESALGGSVSPFVAWMAERGEVSDQELTELKALIAKLDGERKGR